MVFGIHRSEKVRFRKKWRDNGIRRTGAVLCVDDVTSPDSFPFVNTCAVSSNEVMMADAEMTDKSLLSFGLHFSARVRHG